MASYLFAWAIHTNDELLLARVDFPVSELQNMRDSQLQLVSNTILGLGRSYLESLTEYGIRHD